MGLYILEMGLYISTYNWYNLGITVCVVLDLHFRVLGFTGFQAGPLSDFGPGEISPGIVPNWQTIVIQVGMLQYLVGGLEHFCFLIVGYTNNSG